ncbi:tetratricopeptide repeat protein [Actinoplanes sp. TRM 88003]|uniref:Tetratricopeptide repeat protein n=1 Tax=Paractinoplanes aksuensis TaxID=2939490 RepID=A0ABT1DLE7_9ACTN|nr:tetratricopeptide repeat protein [Actinoplanes aksuensis]MCO8271667.1 tetratricopeptide repeat protein [Actinoplanes aksuensis]
MGRPDVFISYAGADRPWAEWAAQELVRTGFVVEIAAWDWAAGDNFVLRMSDAVAGAERILMLCNALFGLGDFAAAREICEDVLARRRRVLGEDHPDCLTSANNLLNVLFMLGEREQGRTVGEQTLDHHRRILGDDHPDTLTTEANLAEGLSMSGENDRARALAEDALERRRRVLGPDHPDTVATAELLAAIRQQP